MDAINDTLPPVSDARFEKMLGELGPEERAMLNEIRAQESPRLVERVDLGTHIDEWHGWVNEAERLLGFSLDGNQEEDGYSLDYAYDAFHTGVAVETYVSGVAVARHIAGVKARL
ncbi:hypothetical protein LCGC14_1583560 [marine sediment metagenome]|uniref:Uncharacterized protein n=1 Tax=marine sediment metagenome TaxID=412755 RepID=A0A0F9IG69_9ZZZZ